MTLLDRIIAGSLSLGIWVWILMSVLIPSFVVRTSY